MSTKVISVLVTWLIFCTVQNTAKKVDTLVLTSVVFRHGDRTPDASTVYPNDPYKNDSYHPVGLGQLTIQGKQRSFKLGKILRNRYKLFLGDEWDFEKYASFSSSYPRTQMTLQLVHAALFPARKEERVDKYWAWQPVDYTLLMLKDDNLIATYGGCPTLFNQVDDYEKNNVEIQNIFNDNKELLEYLSLHSGWNVDRSKLAFFMYSSLKSQLEWGYTIPQWAEQVYPQPLYELASIFSKIYAQNLKFRRVMIGNLLEKITTTSQQKANGTLTPMGRKIYLYSGHETNLISLLGAFDIYDGEDVPYNGYILFELHNIDSTYGMKVYYHNYLTRDPVLIDIKNCGTFCPIDKFYDLLKDNFPGENWCSFE